MYGSFSFLKYLHKLRILTLKLLFFSDESKKLDDKFRVNNNSLTQNH